MDDDRELLIENIQLGGDTWGIRVYSNGDLEVLSDRFSKFENDEVVNYSQPLEWRWQISLTAQEVDHLLDIIQNCGILQLPPLMPSEIPESNPLQTTWRIILDGKEKMIQTVGSQSANHPIFNQLSQEIQEAKMRAMKPRPKRRR